MARKHPEIVREIAEAGHEIASHGMSHRLIYTQTPEALAGRGQQIAPCEDSVHGVELEIVEQMAEPLHAAVKVEVVPKTRYGARSAYPWLGRIDLPGMDVEDEFLLLPVQPA